MASLIIIVNFSDNNWMCKVVDPNVSGIGTLYHEISRYLAILQRTASNQANKT